MNALTMVAPNLEMQDLLLYIGPGLGGGVFALIVGFLASIFLALVAIFWYPIKRLTGIKSTRRPKKSDSKPVGVKNDETSDFEKPS